MCLLCVLLSTLPTSAWSRLPTRCTALPHGMETFALLLICCFICLRVCARFLIHFCQRAQGCKDAGAKNQNRANEQSFAWNFRSAKL